MAHWNVTGAVVGLDGGESSIAACRWVTSVLPEGADLVASHTVESPVGILVDAALGDSVQLRHRLERELTDEWLAGIDTAALRLRVDVREGSVTASLLDAAAEIDASMIVVGHHDERRFGTQVVGQATADLLEHADRPVVIVPRDVDPLARADWPVAIAVGTEHQRAIDWALTHLDLDDGLTLVRGDTRRSLFSPDGWFDALAYYLDPGAIREWITADVQELADRIRAHDSERAADVDVQSVVGHGRTGPALVEAGHAAQAIIVARDEPAFVRRRAMAPSLHRVIANAPCPVIVLPPDE